jgi:hypothetical protein
VPLVEAVEFVCPVEDVVDVLDDDVLDGVAVATLVPAVVNGAVELVTLETIEQSPSIVY